MNLLRRVSNRNVIVKDFIVLGLHLGYRVRVTTEAPAASLPLPQRLREILGWWRPSAIGAINKGFREANA